MIPTIYRYPLDPTGQNPNNLVVDEEHQLSNRAIRCIAPTYGGFFADSVILRNAHTGLTLVKGQDYYFGELLEFPTGRYGHEIFGIIVIKNPSLTRVTVTYQALGGQYSYSMDAVIAMIDSLNLGERPVAWGDIVGRPALFDPASHLHDAGDIYGFEYVVHSIERLRSAILMGDVASHDEIYNYIDQWGEGFENLVDALRLEFESHRDDRTNPHGVTKAQVGLGSVQNYPLALEQEARNGTSHVSYMTPLRTAQAIATQALAPLNDHKADTNNPHNVTKAQVGLGRVENYAVATTEEARGGVVTNKYMTPQLVASAINAQAIVPLSNHLADISNPHRVTKAQVGLGSVANHPLASAAEAVDPNNNERYMAPYSTRLAVNASVNAGLYDNRFITRDMAMNGSISTSGNVARVYVNGAWRQFWPPLWQ